MLCNLYNRFVKLRINSSKVYCKCQCFYIPNYKSIVLIVAKCIVNQYSDNESYSVGTVLIVAKCIVNEVQRTIKVLVGSY